MLKVLFADDEPIMLEGLRLMLDWERLGFSICGEAQDGEDALKLLEEQGPHLVITDIRMPVVDGLALIESASKIRPDTRFIILSGYSDFQYAKQAMRFGAVDYLTKPLDELELEETVRAIAAELIEEESRQEHQAEVQLSAELLARLFPDGAAPALASSMEHRGAEALEDAYQEARSVAANKCRSAHPFLYLYENSTIEGESLAVPELKQALFRAVAAGDKEAVSAAVHQLFAVLSDHSFPQAWAGAFLSMLQLELLQSLPAYEEEREQHLSRWFQPLPSSSSLKSMRVKFTQDMLAAAERQTASGSGRLDPDVSAAADYIKRHYQSRLQLSHAARELRVHPSYLGQRFKKQLGVPFLDYLHQTRAEEAKKLLWLTDLKIADIASRVGYPDADQFTVKFKAITGVSPSAYRKGEKG